MVDLQRRKSRVNPIADLIPAAPAQSVPGLEPLAPISRLFLVQHEDALQLTPKANWTKFFKVYNGEGDHIFSVGETRQAWLPPFHVFLYICSALGGDPIITVVQRASGALARNWIGEHAALFFHADRIISQFYGKTTAKRRLELREQMEPHCWIHVVDAQRGGFLGHYWDAGGSVVILDANLTPTMRLEKRGSGSNKANQELNAAKREDEEAEAHISYFIMEGKTRVGSLSAYSPSANLASSNFTQKYNQAAHFPHEFTQVDKALILGYLAYKQRSVAIEDQLLCTIILVVLTTILLLSIAGLVLGLLYRLARL